MKKNHGWNPDKPDSRDYKYEASISYIPPSVDLRGPGLPPVWSQGTLASCVQHASCAMLAYEETLAGLPAAEYSRLFLYYATRKREGIVNQDGGTYPRVAMKALASEGVCFERLWPYDPLGEQGTRWKEKPTPEAYDDAKTHNILRYQKVEKKLSEMRACLAEGHPFIFGFVPRASFHSLEVATTGIVPLPASGEDKGAGHQMLVVGYDDFEGRFVMRNSFGPSWGDGGYCYFPYELATENSAGDLWMIERV